MENLLSVRRSDCGARRFPHKLGFYYLDAMSSSNPVSPHRVPASPRRITSPSASPAALSGSPRLHTSRRPPASPRVLGTGGRSREDSDETATDASLSGDAVLVTKFHEVIGNSPPPIPPCLQRETRTNPQLKVRVLLRVCPVGAALPSPCLRLDAARRQAILVEPAELMPAARRRDSPPKTFNFDGVFSPDDSLAEICSAALTDLVQAVLEGVDGCLFCYGAARLGKTYTMIGHDERSQLGVIPCAIAWLFRKLECRRGVRFSVRVSAVEVTGRSEKLKDLLLTSASAARRTNNAQQIRLRADPICGARLENLSELRAPDARSAALYLDTAIANRTVPEAEEDARNSHFLFTLHLYQYRLERDGSAGEAVAGGHSRLHLLDLGSCCRSEGAALSLSALGQVVMALLHGQRNAPHRQSVLAQLLRDSLGISCRACMIAHVSAASHAFPDTLQVVQLAARLQRTRRRRGGGGGISDGSSDGSGRRVRSGVRMGTRDTRSFSDPDYSSSEVSVDTVIYVGRDNAQVRMLNERRENVLVSSSSRLGERSPTQRVRSPQHTMPLHSSPFNRVQSPLTSPSQTRHPQRQLVERHSQRHDATPSRGELWIDGPDTPPPVVFGPIEPVLPVRQHYAHVVSCTTPTTTASQSPELRMASPSREARRHRIRRNATDASEQWIDGPSAFQRNESRPMWTKAPPIATKPTPPPRGVSLLESPSKLPKPRIRPEIRHYLPMEGSIAECPCSEQGRDTDCMKTNSNVRSSSSPRESPRLVCSETRDAACNTTTPEVIYAVPHKVQHDAAGEHARTASPETTTSKTPEIMTTSTPRNRKKLSSLPSASPHARTLAWLESLHADSSPATGRADVTSVTDRQRATVMAYVPESSSSLRDSIYERAVEATLEMQESMRASTLASDDDVHVELKVPEEPMPIVAPPTIPIELLSPTMTPPPKRAAKHSSGLHVKPLLRRLMSGWSNKSTRSSSCPNTPTRQVKSRSSKSPVTSKTASPATSASSSNNSAVANVRAAEDVTGNGRNTDSDSGNDSGIVRGETEPQRQSPRSSSGHGSDNSSTSSMAEKGQNKLRCSADPEVTRFAKSETIPEVPPPPLPPRNSNSAGNVEATPAGQNAR